MLKCYTTQKIKGILVKKCVQTVALVLINILICQLSSANESNFGNLSQETTKPLSASSDEMVVDNSSGHADFIGNVEISQGNIFLYADFVRIFYNENKSQVEKVNAKSKVLLVSGDDRAGANEAEYDLNLGTIVLIGSAWISQDDNKISASRIELDIATGSAKMSGKVQTSILSTETEQD